PSQPEALRHARGVGGLFRSGLPRRPVRPRATVFPRGERSHDARTREEIALALAGHALLCLRRRQPRRGAPALVARVRDAARKAPAAAPALAAPPYRGRTLLARDRAIRADLRGRRPPDRDVGTTRTRSRVGLPVVALGWIRSAASTPGLASPLH